MRPSNQHNNPQSRAPPRGKSHGRIAQQSRAPNRDQSHPYGYEGPSRGPIGVQQTHLYGNRWPQYESHNAPRNMASKGYSRQAVAGHM